MKLGVSIQQGSKCGSEKGGAVLQGKSPPSVLLEASPNYQEIIKEYILAEEKMYSKALAF